MSFSVLLTDDAVFDLDELYDYIDLNDVSGNADQVLIQIEKTFIGLSESPS